MVIMANGDVPHSHPFLCRVTGGCEIQESLELAAASVPDYTEAKAASPEMALDQVSIPPSYHGLAIQRIPLRTGLVPAEPMKTLVPSKSKLNTIEAKRIMSVLDEAIHKIELITLMSYMESHPEALEDTLPEDFVRALREHLDIGQTLVERASILQRRHKKLEEEEEAEETRNQERLLSLELHKVNLLTLAHQFRDSTKTVLRLVLGEPQFTRLLQVQAPGRSPGAQCLLDGLVELRGFLFEKLLTSPMEIREKNQFIQDISRRSERNQEVIDDLQAELANVLKNKESEVHLPKASPKLGEKPHPNRPTLWDLPLLSWVPIALSLHLILRNCSEHFPRRSVCRKSPTSGAQGRTRAGRYQGMM